MMISPPISSFGIRDMIFLVAQRTASNSPVAGVFER
jgi:hypothetical protein